MQGLSLVAASGGHSSSRCTGLSLSRPLLLGSTGSRCAGSVVVVHGPSCSAACGIFPDRGVSPCPLHWQADSQPLRHQGSPLHDFNPLKCIGHFMALYTLCYWKFHLHFKRMCVMWLLDKMIYKFQLGQHGWWCCSNFPYPHWFFLLVLAITK